MDINATLNKARGYKIYIGDVMQAAVPAIYHNQAPYFFLHREVGKELRFLADNRLLRHCKLYKDTKYYDYIVLKEFNSIEEWVHDCGGNIADVCYGFSRNDQYNPFVRLNTFLNHLGPVMLPKLDEITELSQFLNKLHVDELKLKDLLVVTKNDGVKSYDTYMNA